MKGKRIRRIGLRMCIVAGMAAGSVMGQTDIGEERRSAIEARRAEQLQPEKVMDAVGLKPGMIVGEAGAGHGFFTFKLSQRVGDRGMVFANDILPELLKYIENKYTSRKITNIKTVHGVGDDPLFPRKNLDMIVIFDCLFEFTRPVQWMKNGKSYLKPGANLVIVDPDPSKMGSNEDIISRKQVLDYARAAGYDPVEVDDSFLKTHMIVVLAPVSSK